MGKREKLSEQTGSPSTPGETFLKAAGQYAGLEDDGFFINHEAPASQGGTMPTLFSTTGLDVTETGKAPARMSGVRSDTAQKGVVPCFTRSNP